MPLPALVIVLSVLFTAAILALIWDLRPRCWSCRNHEKNELRRDSNLWKCINQVECRTRRDLRVLGRK